MKRTLGLHPERETAAARSDFRETCGEAAEARRAEAIRRLPQKDWHGRIVYRLRCAGPFGRGPHDQWVPESLLWALLDLERWCCPYHPAWFKDEVG